MITGIIIAIFFVCKDVITNKLKVVTIGNSVGVVLSKEILDKLRVQKGDSVFAIETSKGIELTPYNPELAEQMKIAEQVMREDRDALRKLAE